MHFIYICFHNNCLGNDLQMQKKGWSQLHHSMSKLHLFCITIFFPFLFSLHPLPFFSFGSLNTIFSSHLLLSVLCRSLKSPVLLLNFSFRCHLNPYVTNTSNSQILTYSLLGSVWNGGERQKILFFHCSSLLPGHHQQFWSSCPCLPSYLITFWNPKILFFLKK